MTSNEVAEQLAWLERHIVTCQRCGRDFASSHPGRAKYCKPACQVAASRERARKRRAS